MGRGVATRRMLGPDEDVAAARTVQHEPSGDSDQALRAKAVLLWVLIVQFAMASILILVWIASPEPGPSMHVDFLPFVSRDPTSFQAAIQDHRDRNLGIAVWILAAVGVLATGACVSRLEARYGPRVGDLRGLLALAATGWAVILLANVVNNDDRVTGYWPGWNRTDGLVAAGLAALVIVVWGIRPSRLGGRILAVGVAVLVLITMWATPHSLRDTVHTGVVLEELLTPATGRAVLHDFFPQYSTLMGLPPSAVVSVTGAEPESVGVAWLVMLQLLWWAMVLAALVRASSIRVLPFAVVCTGILMLVGRDSETMIQGYYQVMPVRYLAPTILLFLLAGELTTTRTLVAGAVGAVAALNNPEWGIPAVLASLFAGALATAPEAWFRLVRTWLVGFAAGGLVVVVGLSALAGEVIDLRQLLLFSQVFGASGFYAVPSIPWGPQWMVFASFVAGAIIGAAILAKRHGHPQQAQARMGQVMVYWNLFALGAGLYWFNRSLQPVLYALFPAWAISVVLSAVAVAGLVDWRRLPRTSRWGALPVVVPVAIIATGFLHVVPLAQERIRIAGGEEGSTPRSADLDQALSVAHGVAGTVKVGLIDSAATREVLERRDPLLLSVGAFGDPGGVVTNRQVEIQCSTADSSAVGYLLIDTSDAPWARGDFPCPGWVQLDDDALAARWRLLARAT